LARVDSDAKLRVAEIQGANDQKIQALQTALDDLSHMLEEKTKALAGEKSPSSTTSYNSRNILSKFKVLVASQGGCHVYTPPAIQPAK